MEKILFAAVLAICLLPSSCRNSTKSYPVEFVERTAVFLPNTKANPLTLVVEIGEDGHLRLNKIETGTISDTSILSEKINVIFEDRKKAGIVAREVVIDAQSEVEKENLEKLIENLVNAKASPIRVIKSNP